MTGTMDRLHELPFDSWTPAASQAERDAAERALENGSVLFLPRLPFRLGESEARYLSPQWSDAKSKNISLRPGETAPRGAVGAPADLSALGAMLARYVAHAESLVGALLPRYSANLARAGTSFRPCEIEGRTSSWRKDDTRLHVDAFPSNPNRGMRILRVFSNVNPAKPRVWRVGEPFEDMAKRYLPEIPRPLPGSAWALEKLHITKSLRSEYDHLMLHLHDGVKADLGYQKACPQEEIPFPPGCTWIVYTDQVMHAAMSGQHAFEQTFHLPVRGLGRPETSPLKVLERLAARELI
jgi:3-deoxy-D-manno-oct-2-ulosonic acid (Kdo) hydroxylase